MIADAVVLTRKLTSLDIINTDEVCCLLELEHAAEVYGEIARRWCV
jgi:hypothetical protein